MSVTISKPVALKTQIELELEFFGEGKTEVPGEKPLGARAITDNKLGCDAESGNRTRATLVGGECSHHCAIPTPLCWSLCLN